MHITVVCPSCHNRYHLNPDMRGKKTRCHNPVCRAVFEVQDADMLRTQDDASEQMPPPSTESRQSGAVGDMVPIVPAEAADVVAPGPNDASWENAPPARKRTGSRDQKWAEEPPPIRRIEKKAEEPDRAQQTPQLTQPVALVPIEVSGPAPFHTTDTNGASERVYDKWDPPPVRQHDATNLPMELPAHDSALTAPVVPATRRRAPLMIASVIVAVAGIAVAIVLWVVTALSQTEDARYASALQQFNDKQYTKAENSLAALANEFPESQRIAEYRFRQALAQALRPAFEVGRDPTDALESLTQFVQAKPNDPLLRDNKSPVREGFDEITKSLTADARQGLTSATDLVRAKQRLRQARNAAKLAGQYGPPRNSASDAEFSKIEAEITKAETRQNAIKDLRTLTATVSDIAKAKQIIAKNQLQGDAEAAEILNRLERGFRDQVVFVEANTPSPPPVERPDERSVVVVTNEVGASVPDSLSEGVTFAMARGVLYALSQKNGQPLWVTRVGLDCAWLPVVIPPNETTPETALVWFSDQSALAVCDVQTGRERSRHVLDSPVLGRPLLIGRRAFVPTTGGKIFELEVDSGRMVGWYQIGMPMSIGGIHEEGTNLAYFPADSQYIYVLDTKQRKCANIIATNHPNGSLRSPPILMRPERADPVTRDTLRAGFLILCQADGLVGTKLRAVPIDNRASSPAPEPEVNVRGWSWFDPVCDGEKIAIATDAGIFGLFGINQPGNQDAPIFRTLPEDPKFNPPNQAGLSRPLVAYARDREFWLLVGGKLRQVQVALDRDKGLRLTETWTQETPLGAPVHAAQTDFQGQRLFLVTHSEAGDSYFATAIDTQTHKILWQRRLGASWRDDPIVLDGRVLTLDRAAALYEFDLEKLSMFVDGIQTAGQLLLPPPTRAGNAGPSLLESPDGKAVYAIALTGETGSLEISRHEPGKNPQVLNVKIRSPLASTPAVTNDCILLPLRDGSLLRQPLDSKPARSGIWRSGPSEKGDSGFVLSLEKGEYLTSDGSRHLIRWKWNAGDESPKEQARTGLTERIVGTPVMLPPGLPGSERFIATADNAGIVRVIQAGDLTTVRMWNVNGKATGGPYFQSGRLMCLVDQKRVVWIDPAHDGVLEYETPGDGIVGQPQMIADSIVVADRNGTIVALDPVTCKPRCPAYTIKMGGPAAATPVAFGANQAFVPLVDGTALLLPLERLVKQE